MKNRIGILLMLMLMTSIVSVSAVSYTALPCGGSNTSTCVRGEIQSILSNQIAPTDTQQDSDIATLQTDLTTETGRATATEDGLQGNITSEATARASADTGLGTSIDSVNSSLNTEKTDRATGDSDANGRIDSVNDTLNQEVLDRTAMGLALDLNISIEKARALLAESGLQDNIDTEKDNREGNDTRLEDDYNSQILSTNIFIMSVDSGIRGTLGNGLSMQMLSKIFLGFGYAENVMRDDNFFYPEYLKQFFATKAENEEMRKQITWLTSEVERLGGNKMPDFKVTQAPSTLTYGNLKYTQGQDKPEVIGRQEFVPDKALVLTKTTNLDTLNNKAHEDCRAKKAETRQATGTTWDFDFNGCLESYNQNNSN